MALNAPTIRFSLLVLGILVISLPLKRSYFTDDVSKDTEVAARQDIGWQIVDLLKAEGFTVLLEPTDGFLPSVAANKGDCSLYITPIPEVNDLDASFLFASAYYAEQVTYYYDGVFSSNPPIYMARFWGIVDRQLPKFGIEAGKHLRLGIAHSASCDLTELDFAQIT